MMVSIDLYHNARRDREDEASKPFSFALLLTTPQEIYIIQLDFCSQIVQFSNLKTPRNGFS